MREELIKILTGFYGHGHDWLEDYCDRIEALYSGWISVEDRLPESGQCVLLFSLISGVAEGAWIESKNHFEQWRWSSIMINVTHWKPLPSPPKSKQ